MYGFLLFVRTTHVSTINSGGFDSLPADIGTYLVCEHLQRVHRCSATAVTYYLASMSMAGASGGSAATIKSSAEEAWEGGTAALQQLANPYLLCPPSSDNSNR
jgi:short subunit dehydrogenase-like uncharacterized protein